MVTEALRAIQERVDCIINSYDIESNLNSIYSTAFDLYIYTSIKSSSADVSFIKSLLEKIQATIEDDSNVNDLYFYLQDNQSFSQLKEMGLFHIIIYIIINLLLFSLSYFKNKYI